MIEAQLKQDRQMSKCVESYPLQKGSESPSLPD